MVMLYEVDLREWREGRLVVGAFATAGVFPACEEGVQVFHHDTAPTTRKAWILTVAFSARHHKLAQLSEVCDAN